MEKALSVVLICSKAADTIIDCLKSAEKLSNDIVVVLTNSDDNTRKLIQQTGARIIETDWIGFGPTKNIGNNHAKHDWIFSLDADEVISDELIQSIKAADLNDTNSLFCMKRLNYIGKQPIKFGEWRNDLVKRLFNRTVIEWDAAPVHEQLQIPEGVKLVKLSGELHHYTCNSYDEYVRKMDRYARLMAEKKYQRGKKAGALKTFLAPVVNFTINYILKLGFLDGKAGYRIAVILAGYTRLKYRYLQQMQIQKS